MSGAERESPGATGPARDGGHDAAARGRAFSAFWRSVSAPLFDEITAAVPLPEAPAARATARREWECLAGYAGVRAIVAAGGFGNETADAVDAFHDALFERWAPDDHDGETAEARRALMAQRYNVFGAIAQGADAHEAETAARLGKSAARRMAADAEPAGLAEIAGDLHLALVEACVEWLTSRS